MTDVSRWQTPLGDLLKITGQTSEDGRVLYMQDPDVFQMLYHGFRVHEHDPDSVTRYHDFLPRESTLYGAGYVLGRREVAKLWFRDPEDLEENFSDPAFQLHGLLLFERAPRWVRRFREHEDDMAEMEGEDPIYGLVATHPLRLLIASSRAIWCFYGPMHARSRAQVRELHMRSAQGGADEIIASWILETWELYTVVRSTVVTVDGYVLLEPWRAEFINQFWRDHVRKLVCP